MAEYIGREVIIKHIEEKLDKLTDMPEMGARIAAMVSAYNSTLNYIMQIPAVDVEPVKHGHWICENLGFGAYRYKCSECGSIYGQSQIEEFRHSKFCGDCGAKMDGEEV